jgi:hypothetical protein
VICAKMAPDESQTSLCVDVGVQDFAMLRKQRQRRRRFAPKRIKEMINILREAGIPVSKIVVGEMTFETGKLDENGQPSVTPLEEWRAKRRGEG